MLYRPKWSIFADRNKNRDDKREQNINKITIPSMTKWAMILNVSRPSLHREIKRLENEHLIRSHDHVIDILDKEGLQDILSK